VVNGDTVAIYAWKLGNPSWDAYSDTAPLLPSRRLLKNGTERFGVQVVQPGRRCLSTGTRALVGS
jgi:hypothetical protein